MRKGQEAQGQLGRQSFSRRPELSLCPEARLDRWPACEQGRSRGPTRGLAPLQPWRPRGLPASTFSFPCRRCPGRQPCRRDQELHRDTSANCQGPRLLFHFLKYSSFYCFWTSYKPHWLGFLVWLHFLAMLSIRLAHSQSCTQIPLSYHTLSLGDVEFVGLIAVLLQTFTFMSFVLFLSYFLFLFLLRHT